MQGRTLIKDFLSLSRPQKRDRGLSRAIRYDIKTPCETEIIIGDKSRVV